MVQKPNGEEKDIYCEQAYHQNILNALLVMIDVSEADFLNLNVPLKVCWQ